MKVERRENLWNIHLLFHTLFTKYWGDFCSSEKQQIFLIHSGKSFCYGFVAAVFIYGDVFCAWKIKVMGFITVLKRIKFLIKFSA